MLPTTHRWTEWRAWLNPVAHPWIAFAGWGVLLAMLFASAGRRSARREPSLLQLPAGKVSGVERQPTIARQLELARKLETDDAWWAVLLYFEGNQPEKHFARQALIPRLLQQQRLNTAGELCDEVLKADNAPESAVVTAWAGRALLLTLEGRMADAERIEEQHLRRSGEAIERPLGAWLDESLRHRRGPPIPQRGPDRPDRSRDR